MKLNFRNKTLRNQGRKQGSTFRSEKYRSYIQLEEAKIKW